MVAKLQGQTPSHMSQHRGVYRESMFTESRVPMEFYNRKWSQAPAVQQKLSNGDGIIYSDCAILNQHCNIASPFI